MQAVVSNFSKSSQAWKTLGMPCTFVAFHSFITIIFFLSTWGVVFEANYTPSGMYNFHICNCSSKHVQNPEHRSICLEATKMSWQTLWLHKVYTSQCDMQLCTLNLCGLYFLPSAFFSFHLGWIFFLRNGKREEMWEWRPSRRRLVCKV